jgi:hypothetical protein
VAGVLFALIALLQAARAALEVPVQIGSTSIPFAASWFAAVVFGALAIWAFRRG